MPEITPQEDLLDLEEINIDIFRSDLMPLWFKICMGLLLIYNMREFMSFPALYDQYRDAPDFNQPTLLVTFLVYLLVALAMILVRYLFHMMSDYAVKVAIPVMIISWFLAILLAIMLFFSGESYLRQILLVSYSVVLAAAFVHILRVRNKWKDASPFS